MPHYRCPACGQSRPQRAFDHAGNHQLEVIELRGLGQGKGFDRSSASPDVSTLSYLLDCLDRARAQIIREIEYANAAAVAALPASVPACPNCRTSMTSWGQHWTCSSCGTTF